MVWECSFHKLWPPPWSRLVIPRSFMCDWLPWNSVHTHCVLRFVSLFGGVARDQTLHVQSRQSVTEPHRWSLALHIVKHLVAVHRGILPRLHFTEMLNWIGQAFYSSCRRNGDGVWKEHPTLKGWRFIQNRISPPCCFSTAVRLDAAVFFLL